MNIQKIDTPKQKEYICNTILRSLPNWFGIEDAITDYVNKTQSMPFWAAYIKDAPVGFITIKNHNQYTSEVYVMAVLSEYHRQGIGKQLIKQCENFSKKNGMEYLTVKTLDKSVHSESYEKTRNFYLAIGFRPLEVFPLLWDKDNPCLFLVKHI